MKLHQFVVGMLALAFCASAPEAEAAKAAASLSKVTVCGVGGPSCLAGTQVQNGVWQDVMSSSIKTANITDLFIDVSMVTGLYTSTTVKGNNTGTESSAVAMGGVKVRVLLDGQPALTFPDRGDGITFDQRVQTLTAKLGNIFTDCFAQGGNTGTGCTLDPQELSLALDTTSAHSFNYILLNVGPGMHTVTVQAMVNTRASGNDGGTAVANAIYGMGTMTVDAVALTNSFLF
ncbi:hypothetical protein [Polyangium aurulentum]|uniref:hypothetical protein n=1 Tax=Polyangium aurulentum TaxID=2567896 RepID=UPI0010AE8D1D|nr:hypothetical protein [Polyangium aurulentum]UQA54792.1 hypothetical protein E8A73_025835 [Polyangium aurulentum]